MLTRFVSQFWIFDHNLSCSVCSSLHLSLILSCTVPLDFTALFGRPPTSLEFLHSLSLYAFCPRHNSRRRSLFMRVSRNEWPVSQLTEVYSIVRVLRDLDCPLLPSRSLLRWRKDSVQATEILYPGYMRNAQRWQWSMNLRKILITGRYGAGSRESKLTESTSVACFSSVEIRWLWSLLIRRSELKNSATRWSSPSEI